MCPAGGDTVIDVVMDQRPLRLGNRAFHRMQLRGQINAGSPFLDHFDNPAQMPLGALQPGCDGRVACMDMRF